MIIEPSDKYEALKRKALQAAGWAICSYCGDYYSNLLDECPKCGNSLKEEATETE